MSAWDKELIAEGVLAPDLNNEIRANWAALEAALTKEHLFSTGETPDTNQGHHRPGSARCYFQDAQPGTRINGDAFTSADLGSLWIDTNSTIDNQFNILTATTPTWTPVSTEIIAVLLASARTFAEIITFSKGIVCPNTYGINSNTVDGSDNAVVKLAGGGAPSATRGAVLQLFGNEHATNPGDLFIAPGDTGNITVGTNKITNVVDPAADQDAATKKYVDDQLAAAVPDDDAFGTWASATKGSSTLAASDGILVAYGHSTSGSPMTIKTDSANPPTTIRSKDCDDDGNTQGTVMSPVKKGDYYLISNSTTAFWLPIGA